MKLSQISIKNFRAFQEKRSINIYDFTSLIGANNCGKSTILRAIELFLNQEKPVDADWCKLGTGNIEIAGKFTDIQDWERVTPGVAGIIQHNEINLRVTFDRETKKPTYEAYIQRETIEGLDINSPYNSIREDYKAILMDLGIGNGTDWRLAANKERFKQYLRDNHADKINIGEREWTSENISIDAALKQALPRVELIPAVRDASEDTKPQAKTSFGKLLNTIILPAIQGTAEYTQLKAAVEQLSSRLRTHGENGAPEKITQLVEDITSKMSELVDIKAVLTIAEPDAEKFLGSNAILRLDDGTETEISYQGHGAQRALIYSLIDVIANQSNQVRNDATIHTRATLILFEEPELYLHPHLMRHLKDSLIKISKKPAWQVVISTHSPFLIDILGEPKSIVLFRRAEGVQSPLVCQLSEDPYNPESKEALRAALDFHPTVTEAFFAKRVILVEGDSEIAILKHSSGVFQKYGIDPRMYFNTTIVSCGGKWTIPAIASVLTKLSIPFRIVHDKDAKGRTEEQLAAVSHIDPYSANRKILESVGNPERIFIVDDTLENLLWPGEEVSSTDKPYKAWKRIKEITDQESYETNFPGLKLLYEFVFNW